MKLIAFENRNPCFVLDDDEVKYFNKSTVQSIRIINGLRKSITFISRDNLTELDISHWEFRFKSDNVIELQYNSYGGDNFDKYMSFGTSIHFDLWFNVEKMYRITSSDNLKWLPNHSVQVSTLEEVSEHNDSSSNDSECEVSNMKEKKFFVATPMTGHNHDDVREKINTTIEIFKEKYPEYSSATFVDNLDLPDEYDNSLFKYPDVAYLGHGLKELANCDGIIFTYDFSGSNGCMCEQFISDTYGIKRFIIEDYEFAEYNKKKMLQKIKDDIMDVKTNRVEYAFGENGDIDELFDKFINDLTICILYRNL